MNLQVFLNFAMKDSKR